MPKTRQQAAADQRQLRLAVASGDAEGVLRVLGTTDADPNEGALLHVAVRAGDVAKVDVLLKHPDIDVNQENGDGSTALTLASEHGHTEVVVQLLASPDIDVNKARTPTAALTTG